MGWLRLMEAGRKGGLVWDLDRCTRKVRGKGKEGGGGVRVVGCLSGVICRVGCTDVGVPGQRPWAYVYRQTASARQSHVCLARVTPAPREAAAVLWLAGGGAAPPPPPPPASRCMAWPSCGEFP